jgi:hypothetical protein
MNGNTKGSSARGGAKAAALGLCVLALVFGFALAGCDNPAGGDGGDETPGFQATGLPEVRGTNIPLVQGRRGLIYGETFDLNALNVTGSPRAQDGIMSYSVANGKFSFSLGTPAPAVSESVTQSIVMGLGVFPNSTSGDPAWAVTETPPGRHMKCVGSFTVNSSERTYISRSTTQYDQSGDFVNSGIMYVYVDGDVTLSRGEKTDAPSGITYTITAFNLPLRAGWNLVQRDQQVRSSPGLSSTTTVKIADRDIPWTFNED